MHVWKVLAKTQMIRPFELDTTLVEEREGGIKEQTSFFPGGWSFPPGVAAHCTCGTLNW